MERQYTKAELEQLAKEYGATSPAIKAALVDYGKLRDKARACRGIKVSQ